MKMRLLNNILFLVLLNSLSFLYMGCSNIFSSTGNKTSDEALLHDARNFLGEGEFQSAIDKVAEMSATAQASREIKFIVAASRAGLCGLDFLILADALQNADSSTLFGILNDALTGAALTDVAECITSEGILNGIGDDTVRNSDENLLMAFMSLTKMGAILNSRADTDNDGSVDAGWDPCDGTGATDMPDDDTNNSDLTNMVTGFGNFVTSFTAAAAGPGSETLTQMQDACTELTDNGFPDICSVTEESGVTQPMRQAMRVLIREGASFGLNICTDPPTTPNDVTNCAIPGCSI